MVLAAAAAVGEDEKASRDDVALLVSAAVSAPLPPSLVSVRWDSSASEADVVVTGTWGV